MHGNSLENEQISKLPQKNEKTIGLDKSKINEEQVIGSMTICHRMLCKECHTKGKRGLDLK